MYIFQKHINLSGVFKSKMRVEISKNCLLYFRNKSLMDTPQKDSSNICKENLVNSVDSTPSIIKKINIMYGKIKLNIIKLLICKFLQKINFGNYKKYIHRRKSRITTVLIFKIKHKQIFFKFYNK